MKRNCYLLLMVIFLVFNIISCDVNIADIKKQHGYDIYFDKYYDWCMRFNREDCIIDEGNLEYYNSKTGETFGFDDTDMYLLGSGNIAGTTEWIDWQSEEGRRLHSYIGNSKIKEDFQGKFKISITLDKYILIFFNDNNNTVIRFETFYGDWQYDKDNKNWAYDKTLWEKEEKENEFSYSCWLRELEIKDFESSYITGCSDSNRARITIRKLENTDTDNMFGYTLSIQGKKIIDCKMYNYNYKSPKIEEMCSETNNCLITLYDCSWAPFIDNQFDRDSTNLPDLSLIYLTFPNYVPFFHSYNKNRASLIISRPYYGMSIRKIDEENKTISINIIDEDNCAFADYFTYIYNEDNSKRVINYYKSDNKGGFKLVKTIKGDIATNGENNPDLYK